MVDPSIPLPAEVFATRLREIREAKNWTQQQLADFCTSRLHYPISRATIAQLEQSSHTRSQRVTLNEAVILAYALGVPFLSAIFPTDESPVKVTPSEPMGSTTARAWATGEKPLGDPAFYERYSPAANVPKVHSGMADFLRLAQDVATAFPDSNSTHQEQGFALQKVRLGLEVLTEKLSGLLSELRWKEAELVSQGMSATPPANEPAVEALDPNDTTALRPARRSRKQ